MDVLDFHHEKKSRPMFDSLRLALAKDFPKHAAKLCTCKFRVLLSPTSPTPATASHASYPWLLPSKPIVRRVNIARSDNQNDAWMAPNACVLAEIQQMEVS